MRRATECVGAPGQSAQRLDSGAAGGGTVAPSPARERRPHTSTGRTQLTGKQSDLNGNAEHDSDFLDQKRGEIEARLVELKPLVAEYERLYAAAAALDGVTTTAVMTPVVAASSAASARAKSSKRSGGKTGAAATRGRPKGSGQRGDQALELVKQTPGITIREIAKAMGIQQNYLYRVLPALEQDGHVRREGKGWHPTASAATPAGDAHHEA